MNKQLIPNFESISYLVVKIKEYINKEFKSLYPLKRDKELVKLLSAPVDLQHYSVPEYIEGNNDNDLSEKWVNLITKRGCEGIFTYNGHPIFAVSPDIDSNYVITIMEKNNNSVSLRDIELNGKCLVDSEKQTYIYFVNFPNGYDNTIIYYFGFDESYNNTSKIYPEGQIEFNDREYTFSGEKMFYDSSSTLVTNPSKYESKRYCYFGVDDSIMWYSSENIYNSTLTKEIHFDNFLITTPISITSSTGGINIDGKDNESYSNPIYILRTLNTNTVLNNINKCYNITTETYLYSNFDLLATETYIENFNKIYIKYIYKKGDNDNIVDLNYTIAEIINGSIYNVNTQPSIIEYEGKKYYFSGTIVNENLYNFDTLEIQYYTK